MYSVRSEFNKNMQFRKRNSAREIVRDISYRGTRLSFPGPGLVRKSLRVHGLRQPCVVSTACWQYYIEVDHPFTLQYIVICFQSLLYTCTLQL